MPDADQLSALENSRIQKKESELSIPPAISSDLETNRSQVQDQDLLEEHRGNFAVEANAVISKHYSKVQV